MKCELLTVLLIATAAGCDVGANGSPSQSSRAPTVEVEPPKPTETEPVPAPQRTLDRSFDELKFEMAEGEAFRREMLTAEIEALDGHPIRIRGYILPTAHKRGLKTFVLVRDNLECCFGPGAALFDCILVEMSPGKTTEFSPRPVAVEGEFAIEIFPGPDDRPLAIYRMTGESVK